MSQLVGLFFSLFFKLFLSRKCLVFKIAVFEKEGEGEILKIPILSGLHNHYFRKAA